MSAINAISPEKLSRLIGTPKCPVRTYVDFGGPPHVHPIGVRVFGNGTYTDRFTGQKMVR